MLQDGLAKDTYGSGQYRQNCRMRIIIDKNANSKELIK